MDDYVDANNNVHSSDFDDMYEFIEINYDLSLRFFKALILDTSDEQSNPLLENGPHVELIVAPSTILNFSPLASCPLSLNDVKKAWEVDDFLD